MIDKLHGVAYLTKVVSKSRYQQIILREEDILETNFRTHEGNYEFFVIPFGLLNAQSTFQRPMNIFFYFIL